ncbi:YfhD family protein [Cohnella sp. AR92]|uniref:YfhD family protein n=1 Tax=Cohnella sp. AR92 TaxID=648716 RepID=UPI000F8E5288|nr:YfhD family protein [Cohnella sp. AR92]RUS48513.1 YfhD family protein [Cohnella sp. AR92]
MKESTYRQQGSSGEAGASSSLPTAKAEDVEFSSELADEEDRVAQKRAAEADKRAASYEGD